MTEEVRPYNPECRDCMYVKDGGLVMNHVGIQAPVGGIELDGDPFRLGFSPECCFVPAPTSIYELNYSGSIKIVEGEPQFEYGRECMFEYSGVFDPWIISPVDGWINECAEEPKVNALKLPTPTPTRSQTPTPTITPSITPTITPTISVSPTISPSPSFSPTATASASPTPTATPSYSPTATPTRSPSRTPAASQSPTRSGTPTPTPTRSREAVEPEPSDPVDPSDGLGDGGGLNPV